jgi:glycosyltransferase involved in cell wall biosynthesis
MIARADAVVCSTLEQREDCLKYNRNVHDILDFNDDQIHEVKKKYAINGPVHLVWEGMGGNAWAFREIAEALKRVHRRIPLALHLVTDIKFKKFNIPGSPLSDVRKSLQSFLGDVPFYLYEWNSQMLAPICASADIALLPIPQTPAIYWAKPENRLLMMWRMGLPVLASANPAFSRCMKAAGTDMSCLNQTEWEEKLVKLIENENLRRSSAQSGMSYAIQHASQEVLSAKWHAVLESIQ